MLPLAERKQCLYSRRRMLLRSWNRWALAGQIPHPIKVKGSRHSISTYIYIYIHIHFLYYFRTCGVYIHVYHTKLHITQAKTKHNIYIYTYIYTYVLYVYTPLFNMGDFRKWSSPLQGRRRILAETLWKPFIFHHTS